MRLECVSSVTHEQPPKHPPKRHNNENNAISSESNESYMLGAGKSLLVHDDVDTMEQVYAKVRDLTAAQLTEVAEAVFSNMSRLIYK